MTTVKSSTSIGVLVCFVFSIEPVNSVTAQDDQKAVVVVKGSVTSFEWIGRPDKNTSWDEAKSWVDDLDVGGGGWRMPTIEELKTIHQEAMETQSLHLLIKATGGGFMWSCETKDPNLAWSLSVFEGEGSWTNRNISDDGRAFAVRTRK